MRSPSTASATTFPFLAVLMRNERWKEGRLSTKFIAEEFPEGFKPPQAGRRGARYAGRGRRGDRPYEQCAAPRHHPADARRAGALCRDPHRRAWRGAGEGECRGRARRADYRDAWRRRKGEAEGDHAGLLLVVRRTRVGRHGRRRAGRGAGAPDPQRREPHLSGRRGAGAGLHRARDRACGADAGQDEGRHVEIPALPDAGARGVACREPKARRSRRATRSAWSRR